MANTLNGWKRLGIVTTVLWMFCVSGLAIFEPSPSPEGFSQGVFVNHAIPAGITIEGSKVTLPDGKIVKVEAIDPTSGRALNPWEIDWRKYPEIPKTKEILWVKLAVVALAIPAAIWLLLELFVAVTRWVVRGFKETSGDS